MALMCRLLGVSTTGFYDYLVRRQRPTDLERLELLNWVKELAKASKFSYGSRRMSKGLRALGYPVGRDMARGLIEQAQAWVRYKKPYKVTTQSGHKKPVFKNLLKRKFDVAAPDRVYASDITYGAPSLGRRLDDVAWV